MQNTVNQKKNQSKAKESADAFSNCEYFMSHLDKVPQMTDSDGIIWSLLTSILLGKNFSEYDQWESINIQNNSTPSPKIYLSKNLPKISEDTLKAILDKTGQQCLKLKRPVFDTEKRLLAIDGSTIQIPDTAENIKVFPPQADMKNKGGLGLMRIVVMFDVKTGAILGLQIAPFVGKGTGETSLAFKLLDSLSSNDVLVGDKAYFTYSFRAILQLRGIHYIFPVKNKTKHILIDPSSSKKSDKRVYTVKSKDSKTSIISKEEYAKLPLELEERFITVANKKNKKIILATSLLDPHTDATKSWIINAYKERWSAEMRLREIKNLCKHGRLDLQKPDRCVIFFQAVVAVYNFIRLRMCYIARQAHTIGTKISFKRTLMLMRKEISERFIPCLFKKQNHQQEPALSKEKSSVAEKSKPSSSVNEQKSRRLICRRHHKEIAKFKVGNRPGRWEPRALKCRPVSAKRFPCMKQKRSSYVKKPTRKRSNSPPALDLNLANMNFVCLINILKLKEGLINQYQFKN